MGSTSDTGDTGDLASPAPHGSSNGGAPGSGSAVRPVLDPAIAAAARQAGWRSPPSPSSPDAAAGAADPDASLRMAYPPPAAPDVFEQQVAVGAGSSTDVAVAVAAGGGGVVGWQWAVEGAAHDDVAFSALFIPGATNGKQVYKASRDAAVIEAAAEGRRRTDAGTFDAPSVGVLLLRFDNTFSWLRPKTLALTLTTAERADEWELAAAAEEGS